MNVSAVDYQTCLLSAGTIFQDTKKPLTIMVPCDLAWITTQKYGAKRIRPPKDILGFGSYRTAWAVAT